GTRRDQSHRAPTDRAQPHPARSHRVQPRPARTARALPRRAGGYRAWRTQHRDRLGAALPGLFGPSRRAAWRRFVLRRVLAAALIAVGLALAFFAGMTTAPRP
ncbi:MAG: hypothetical protein Q4G67_14175, partial [Actinomycetia bacterium]|nr:hypothetical protein [Actinomycetes bacterium]